MNRDDVIRMAREAWGEGAVYRFDSPKHWPEVEEMFVRFAALVAAAEREVCAKVAEDTGNISGNMNKTWRNGCFDAAFAIRAREQG
jgi:hypothetical protein